MIGAIVLIAAAGGYAAGRTLFRPVSRISQPIAFSHAIHAGDLEIECTHCHDLVETGRHAGLPALTVCMGCHEDQPSEAAEALKVAELAAAGEDDVFRKLFRLADHTFYSHRRHVKLGEVACETCHGAIASTSAPPDRPLVRVSMDFCVGCHERTGAALDCTRCHS